MKVFIYGNKHNREAIEATRQFILYMTQRGISCAVEKEFLDFINDGRDALEAVTPVDRRNLPDTDMAISLGGDGTFLSTVMWMAPVHTPILGINTGHLGYLTACQLDEARDMIDSVLRGDYLIEERTMVHVDCDEADIQHPFALNEVAILRHDTSSMIEMDTRLQGSRLTTYKGDGLVVSTPTGSTAYNLSAGGPIMAPQAPCLVITPVSPHSLTMRPLVVPDDARIDITTTSRSGQYLVSLDGESFTCPSGSTVTITRSPLRVKVVQRRGHNFTRTLQQKLHWGVY